MPRVRLFLQEREPVVPCDYLGRGRIIRRHPLLRPTASLMIHPPPGRAGLLQVETGLIDTGAWVSLVRPDAWEGYAAAGLLEFISLPGAAETYSTAIGGVESPCRLGRLSIRVYGPSPSGRITSLPPVRVLAQLLANPRLNSDRIMPFPIVLGLHGGVLDGRRLVREPVPAAATGRRSDAGPTHGQEWFLETV